MAEPALSQLYDDSRARLLTLVSGLDEKGLAAPVPACPGWRVRDVVAHLTAVGEDVLEGRLTGPPTEEQSAAQVARFVGRPFAEVQARWDELAPRFASAIDGFEVWPAVLDVAAPSRTSGARSARRGRATATWCDSARTDFCAGCGRPCRSG
jgi:uncharacterized protein (TIGR03083 family)